MEKLGSKKGAFASVSAMLLVIVLLAFALQLSGQPGKLGTSATSLLNLDRVADKYANMESQISRIVFHYTNITAIENTVMISETFPLNPAYAEDLDNFAAFEQNFSSLNVSLNLTKTKNGSFIIQPNGALITQSDTQFNITAGNSSAGGISEYRITIIFPMGTVDSAAWDTLNAVDASDPDALPVSILIEDEEYLLDNISGVYAGFYETINRSATSRINITRGAMTVGYVKFSPPGSLEIYSASGMDLKVLTRFTNPVYVEANDTLSVKSFANKTGAIRIS